VDLPWTVALAVVDEGAITVLRDLPEEDADGGAVGDRFGIDRLRRLRRPYGRGAI
jgi:hypothetical protein